VTLQQLRYFLALCQEQSFSGAARRCGVAQPSITRAIKELEAEFGGPLFVRSRKSTRLSALGMVVRPYFTDVDRSIANAKQEAADFLARRSDSIVELKERSMRKFVYGTAIAAGVLLVAFTAFRSPKPVTTTSPAQAYEIIDIRALEAAIDVKSLPQLDVDVGD
jgi:hypothetical protein